METKKCSRCSEEKPLDMFSNDKSRKNGKQRTCKECVKKYREENKEKLIESSKKYYQLNKEKMIEKNKKYYQLNKEQTNKRRNKWRNEKFKSNPLFKLEYRIRHLISRSIKNKKNTKTEQILGCSIDEFKKYIEKQFEPWMTWENYGNKNGIANEENFSWDIDHIIPISSAKTEEELLKLNHYTNLQPLDSYFNRYIKRDKILIDNNI